MRAAATPVPFFVFQSRTDAYANVVSKALGSGLPVAAFDAAGVDKLVTLSDHRDAASGEALGLLIKELRLLVTMKCHAVD